MKIDKCTVSIKGKEYNFLKPTAMEIIEIEDNCIKEDGTFDVAYHTESMLGLVSKKLKVEELVEYNKQVVELSSGDEFVIPEIGYNNWVESMAEITKFSRVELAKKALIAGGLSGDVKLDSFKYNDIDGLASAYFTLYNNEELKSVVETISTFCV